MQNEKLKKFTDFFVKYRRYFCAAVLFVILVVILVKCTGPQKDQKETQNGTQGVTQTTEYQEIGKLQKDADAELVTLMENYYAAYAGGDTDSLEMIAQPLSDNEKSYITTFSEYYEDYQNITCYSTKGATDDSYLVSVCYDLKFKGVDTPAPGMDFFYVERDGKGNLIINNIYILCQMKHSPAVIDWVFPVYISIMGDINHLIIFIFFKCMAVGTDTAHPGYSRYSSHLMVIYIQCIVSLR